MISSSLLTLTSHGRSRILQLWFLLNSLSEVSQAITFNSIPAANLDLSDLGRVGLAGDFSGISLYQYEGQNENGFNTNGSQSLLAPYPDGSFATLASADASITSLCSFVLQDGSMAGVVVGGNFTSLGGIESQGVAMFNPNTSAVTPLAGLSGQVSALLCDQTTNTVFVGGSFRGANSTNAIAWVGSQGWSNLPFEGFNGPVTSITRAANGHIIFGGSFTGLGNTSSPSSPDQQIINVSGANITSGSSSTTTGFGDPVNIVCKAYGIDGAGNTWLLADNTNGFWKADFGFGFQPTKLRLWNTHQEGRGTRTWRYTALPIDGIMNFTYVDPSTGLIASCSSECPLSNDSSIAYQDFHFVNVIGMDSFRIDISAWYGNGGGLSGIELFQNDIYAYALESFNEPSCPNLQIASNATSTGPWRVNSSYQSVSKYLTVTLSDGSNDHDSPTVVFLPDIKESGNYSVNMYTPGCMPDDSCSSRGRVNITGLMGDGISFQSEIFQSNNYDKYDQIYTGYVAASTSSFRPSVTLRPSSGQDSDTFVVAQRVGFSLISSSTGNLNSMFEWDPSQAMINNTDFSNSAYDSAGTSLGSDASVNALITLGDVTFVGGNFSTNSYDNIFAVNTTGTDPLTGGGLNGQVVTLSLDSTLLYCGGNFSSTSKISTTSLNNIAVYDTSKTTWSALGAGVNGQVVKIVPISMNVTSDSPEIVITVTGDFDELLAFDSYQGVSVSGFAVWVPSQNNWLQNVNATTIDLSGELLASVTLPSGGSLYAGSLSSSQLWTNGVAKLGSTLGTFPVHIHSSQPSLVNTMSRRATAYDYVSGVVTGLFYERGGRNVTVLGGHFAATATNGSTINNLVFINGSNFDVVTGVGSELDGDSIIRALAVQNDTLFAGGSLTGTVDSGSVNGLISVNLQTSKFDVQPPALAGEDVSVYSITVRPGTTDVYVGGNFQSAGSLNCPGVCLFDTMAAQWTRPGSGLSGSANTMTWAGGSLMVVGGSLAVNGHGAYLATYSPGTQVWTEFSNSSAIPGPVTALTPANNDASQLWVAGTATNGSAYLMMYDGNEWSSAGSSLGSSTIIRDLQVLALTTGHTATNLVPSKQTLLLTGSVVVPGFGNASAVLFNGTTFQPFALTSSTGGSAGSLSRIFSQQQDYFPSSTKHLALGLIVLIGLAISLALVFVLVVAGVIVERIRRRREGYVPAPTNMFDKSSQMARLPPDQLFGSVGHGGVPQI
ncbi:MAG: hypothetical protein M1818_001468 [Claussenomyces sp. TS43310]|nr:MAG: hypothetical protein M1818_001468 [Claussenomyces sp. TS43310]